MYLVLIAWLYVTLMMAVAEATSPMGTVLGAVMTFVLYGLLPMGIVGYIWAPHHANAPSRRARWPSRPPTGTKLRLRRRPPQPRQMRAARRPLPPSNAVSRRWEKNRADWVTVHHAALLSLP